MNFETPGTVDTDSAFEKIKEEIALKIERASANPLRTSRYLELEGQIKAQKDTFFATGAKTEEDLVLDEAIKQEIIGSAAVVDTIPEYTEMLTQISRKYGLSEEWARDLLAHENAHANVSEQLGYDQIGYGTFFLSNDEGVLESIQPAHIHEEPNAWKAFEVIENGIKTLEAPQEYGNEMSEADISERDELARIRTELGLNDTL